jgi:hypothetical protein
MLEENLCDSGPETLFFPQKFADLRFADRDTKDICGFAICGLILTNLRICNLRAGTPKKFCWLVIADLRFAD